MDVRRLAAIVFDRRLTATSAPMPRCWWATRHRRCACHAFAKVARCADMKYRRRSIEACGQLLESFVDRHGCADTVRPPRSTRWLRSTIATAR